jgi:hypothetical protein
MRILLMLALVTALFSCQKDNGPRPEILEGRWEWVECTGGFTGGVVSSAEDGGTMITLEFEDGRMKRFENRSIVFDLAYTVEKVETTSSMPEFILLENGDEIFFIFNENRLFLFEGILTCEYK